MFGGFFLSPCFFTRSPRVPVSSRNSDWSFCCTCMVLLLCTSTCRQSKNGFSITCTAVVRLGGEYNSSWKPNTVAWFFWLICWILRHSHYVVWRVISSPVFSSFSFIKCSTHTSPTIHYFEASTIAYTFLIGSIFVRIEIHSILCSYVFIFGIGEFFVL